MLLTLNLAGLFVPVVLRMEPIANAGFKTSSSWLTFDLETGLEDCRLSMIGAVTENEAVGTILAVMVVIAVADDPELAVDVTAYRVISRKAFINVLIIISSVP